MNVKSNFIGLCVLEIKTTTTVTIATRLDEVNIKNGNQFRCCKAGSSDFKST